MQMMALPFPNPRCNAPCPCRVPIRHPGISDSIKTHQIIKPPCRLPSLSSHHTTTFPKTLPSPMTTDAPSLAAPRAEVPSSASAPSAGAYSMPPLPVSRLLMVRHCFVVHVPYSPSFRSRLLCVRSIHCPRFCTDPHRCDRPALHHSGPRRPSSHPQPPHRHGDPRRPSLASSVDRPVARQ